MKRFILILLMLFGVTEFLVAQVKRPTIMVVPSDVWCTTNGFMSEVENQGFKQLVPNYRLALQSDPILVSAITQHPFPCHSFCKEESAPAHMLREFHSHHSY